MLITAHSVAVGGRTDGDTHRSRPPQSWLSQNRRDGEPDREPQGGRGMQRPRDGDEHPHHAVAAAQEADDGEKAGNPEDGESDFVHRRD